MGATKLGSRHSTMDPETERSVKWLDGRPEVRKVVMGPFLVRSHSRTPGHCSVRAIEGDRLRVTVYSGVGLRDIWLHTTGGLAVSELIAHRWPDTAPPRATRARSVVGMAMAEKLNAVLGATAPAPVVEAPKPPVVAPPRELTPKPSVSERGLFDGAPEVSGIIPTLRIISPEIASRWLERNKRNRPLSSQVVKRYAEDMRAGRWGISESVIAFDVNDDILNGQHRLWAVLESGVEIKALVATGYPTDAIKYFDDGFVRDAATVYNLTHEGEATVSKRTLSIAKRLMGVEWRAGGPAGGKVPRQEVFALVEKHRAAITFAEQLWTRALRGVSVGSVAAVLARAYYTADRERLQQFIEVLRSGISAGHEDNAAVLLRNWLMMNNVNNLSTQNDAYWKTERALKAFLDREPLTRNLYRAESEQFPLPE